MYGKRHESPTLGHHAVAILDEVYTPDLVWHEPDQDLRGPEEAKQFVTMYKTAFPDLHATVEDEITEGDKVVTRWTIRGTHQGEIEEFGPPTGRQVEIKGITIHRIEDGKIVEAWTNFDALGMMWARHRLRELTEGG